MQIAITTDQPRLDAHLDPRFGSAPYILLVDTEQMGCAAYQNPAPAMGGHGIVAARFVAMQGADAVVSGDYCPHSFGALHSIGVALYAGDPAATAAEVVERFLAEGLPAAAPAAGHGHHAHHAAR